jgi:Rrf2 family protein
LRAVVWLAQNPGQPLKVREIAEGTKSPPGYLVKVLQNLAKAGILSAQRGSLGGYKLERDPVGLTILEVINAVDPIERIQTCPLGLKSHGTCLCPMHKHIDDAMAAIEASFASCTIHEVVTRPAKSRPLYETIKISMN